MRIFLILLLMAGCCTTGTWSDKDETGCPWQLAGSGTSFPIQCFYDFEVEAWRVRLLTAGHVSSAIIPPFTALHDDGRVLTDGVILGIHPTEDAGLVEFLSSTKVDPVEINWTPLSWGERVLVPGYQGMDLWIVEGLVSTEDRCSTPMYGGGSGSPVLDDAGRVRALVVAVSAYFEGRQLVLHHCHILPLYKIRDWLCSELR